MAPTTTASPTFSPPSLRPGRTPERMSTPPIEGLQERVRSTTARVLKKRLEDPRLNPQSAVELRQALDELERQIKAFTPKTPKEREILNNLKSNVGKQKMSILAQQETQPGTPDQLGRELEADASTLPGTGAGEGKKSVGDLNTGQHPRKPETEQRYKALQVIEGGMGKIIVYWDTKLLRKVCKKTFNPNILNRHGHGTSQKRALTSQQLTKEAKAMAMAKHSNLIQILDITEDRTGNVSIWIPYIDGTNLNDLTQARERTGLTISEKEMLEYFRGIAKALRALHEKGLIHRDIKPSNILIEKASDEAIVIDLGLATEMEGEMEKEAGTPPYRAPEQNRNHEEDLTPAVDVWALGASLLFCRTRKIIYNSRAEMGNLTPDEQEQRAAAIIKTEIFRKDLRAFLKSCMLSDPKKRPTMNECVQTLDDLIVARGGLPTEHLTHRKRTIRNRRRAVIAAILVAIGAGKSLQRISAGDLQKTQAMETSSASILNMHRMLNTNAQGILAAVSLPNIEDSERLLLAVRARRVVAEAQSLGGQTPEVEMADKATRGPVSELCDILNEQEYNIAALLLKTQLALATRKTTQNADEKSSLLKTANETIHAIETSHRDILTKEEWAAVLKCRAYINFNLYRQNRNPETLQAAQVAANQALEADPTSSGLRRLVELLESKG